jgi:hypothetical protein
MLSFSPHGAVILTAQRKDLQSFPFGLPHQVGEAQFAAKEETERCPECR